MDLTYKAHFVTSGYTTVLPTCMTYARIISRKVVRVAFLLSRFLLSAFLGRHACGWRSLTCREGSAREVTHTTPSQFVPLHVGRFLDENFPKLFWPPRTFRHVGTSSAPTPQHEVRPRCHYETRLGPSSAVTDPSCQHPPCPPRSQARLRLSGAGSSPGRHRTERRVAQHPRFVPPLHPTTPRFQEPCAR